MTRLPTATAVAIDWDTVSKRVYVHVRSRCIHSGASIGGQSAEDLVNTAFQEFFGSKAFSNWTGSEQEAVRLLTTIATRRYLDQARRNRKFDANDPEAVFERIQGEDESSVEQQVLSGDLERALIAKIDGRPDRAELEDFIVACGMIDGTGLIDQQLAELLKADVAEVRNLRKRLRRLVSAIEIRGIR